MTTKTFPDGTIELVMSGKSCPPGFTGQAGNMSTCWYRVDGGEWQYAAGSMHRNVSRLEAAASVSEFNQQARW